MALARCVAHPPDPGKWAYVKAVPAAGRGLVCGVDGCRNDAEVWLTADDVRAYTAGETIFPETTVAAKFRVQKLLRRAS